MKKINDHHYHHHTSNDDELVFVREFLARHSFLILVMSFGTVFLYIVLYGPSSSIYPINYFYTYDVFLYIRLNWKKTRKKSFNQENDELSWIIHYRRCCRRIVEYYNCISIIF